MIAMVKWCCCCRTLTLVKHVVEFVVTQKCRSPKKIKKKQMKWKIRPGNTTLFPPTNARHEEGAQVYYPMWELNSHGRGYPLNYMCIITLASAGWFQRDASTNVQSYQLCFITKHHGYFNTTGSIFVHVLLSVRIISLWFADGGADNNTSVRVTGARTCNSQDVPLFFLLVNKPGTFHRYPWVPIDAHTK